METVPRTHFWSLKTHMQDAVTKFKFHVIFSDRIIKQDVSIKLYCIKITLFVYNMIGKFIGIKSLARQKITAEKKNEKKSIAVIVWEIPLKI